MVESLKTIKAKIKKTSEIARNSKIREQETV